MALTLNKPTMNLYNKLKKWRARLLVFLTHKMALPVLRIIRKPVKFPYTAEELKGFAGGTLGKTLVEFLDKKELDLLPYYAKHDIKHILLQYDTTGEGEVCLQCFMMGNGHLSFPVLATVIYGFVTMPEYWKQFRKAYRRGKRYEYMESWKWFEVLGMPVAALRNNMKLKKNYENNQLL